MRKSGLFLWNLTPVIILTCFLSACSVDSSYDLSKNIDLTMGLGSDSLALKLGNTEKMYLKDIIKVDDSDMLDTITSGENVGLYYLYKKDSSNIDVKVDSISYLKVGHINMTKKIIKGPRTINIPSPGITIPLSMDSTFAFTARDIPDEVKEIHTLTFKNDVYATITLSTNNSNFKLASYSNLKITFPDFIKSTSFTNQTYNVPDGDSLTISFPVESIEFPVTGSFGQPVKGDTISQTGTVFINGNINVYTTGTINLAKTEDSLVVKFRMSFSPLSVDVITGLVNPSIDPTINPIDISSDLPDFLQDDNVHLDVSNPTLKFNIDGDNLPIPLLFNGKINSIKDNQTIASVSIPESGSVSIAKNTTSSFYFSQTGSPFDPSGVNASAQDETVSNLSSLVETIPDEIEVDLSDNKITADTTTEHSIQLEKTYGADFNYEVYIPFQFDSGLSIIYNDSVVDMNDDLKNYQAEGLTITATAINSIPLDLTLQITPYDVDGNEISDISVETISISAGSLESQTTADLSAKFTTTTSSDISKIDKLLFKVSASASDIASGEVLLSTQYIQLTDVRIKLNGQITTNFN